MYDYLNMELETNDASNEDTIQGGISYNLYISIGTHDICTNLLSTRREFTDS